MSQNKQKQDDLAAESRKRPADSDEILPISNLPKLKEFIETTPSLRDMEIFRLRRQVKNLRSQNRRLNQKISFHLSVLGESQRLWELGLQEDQWPTLQEVYRHVLRFDAAIKFQGRIEEDPELERTWPRVDDKKMRSLQLDVHLVRLDRLSQQYAALDAREDLPRFSSERDKIWWAISDKCRLEINEILRLYSIT